MSVRGYAPYDPKPEAIHWINRTNEVLREYKDYWPLSVRQLFYRLVADHSYEKSETAYGRLTQIISRGRRAGYIPWDGVRDGGLGRSVDPTYFDSGEDFYEQVRKAAETMKLDRQDGQEQVVELWCEAGGMVPILEGIADPYSARVNTGGGYDSVTAKHRLAERVRGRAAEGLKTLILHVGDFDGSGEDMANVLRDDALHMVAYQVVSAVTRYWRDEERDPDLWRSAPWEILEECVTSGEWSREATLWAVGFFEVERVALTAEQVVDRGVETAPPKKSDSRTAEFVRRNAWVAEELGTSQITAQLEALTPPELNEVISEALEAHLDMEVYRGVLEAETPIRAKLLERLGD